MNDNLTTNNECYHDDNHEPIQPCDEIVSTQQPWQSPTPSFKLPRTDVSTPITTFVGFQNQPPHTNINLVPTNLKMERLHLLNMLEELCHINIRPSNQLVYIPH
jgi:hypothetical protein